jgi:predicted nucleic acid-binding protein
MYLADTNIFLEILLKQDKSVICKAFLYKNIDSIHISDFTLHSIGVILFKQNED